MFSNYNVNLFTPPVSLFSTLNSEYISAAKGFQ